MTRERCISIILSAACVLMGSAAFSEGKTRAFPGAEGRGAFSKGGRGGKVFLVTTLKDYDPENEKPIPGSFRAACSALGPRTVVFRVSGYISLKKALYIANPYLTIAGQTAPGDGICIKGPLVPKSWRPPFLIATHDIIIRYIRIRLGDEGSESFDKKCYVEHDAITVDDRYKVKTPDGKRAGNIIVDHCSLGWAMDETIAGGGDSMTVQWCIISKSLVYSRHPDGMHSMGIMSMATFHHNLIAKHETRAPAYGGYYRNNVFYLCGGYGVGDVTLNLVGNYIKRPNQQTDKLKPLFLIFSPEKAANVSKKAHGIYARDNILEAGGKVIKDDRRLFCMARFHAAKWKEFCKAKTMPTERKRPYIDLWVGDLDKFMSDTPVKVLPAGCKVTTDTAAEAYRKVLASAGASLPRRDAVDRRIVEEVKTNTGVLINSPKDVGGYPELKSVPPPKDTDADGMPDKWEKTHGLNPKDASDNIKDKDGDGYTNIEEWMNDTDPGKK